VVKPVLIIPIPRESAVDATLASLLLQNRPNRARFVFSEANLYVVDHFDTVSRMKLGVKLSHFQFIHRAGSLSFAGRISHRNAIAPLLFQFYHHVIAFQTDRKALYVAAGESAKDLARRYVELRPVQRASHFIANQRALAKRSTNVRTVVRDRKTRPVHVEQCQADSFDLNRLSRARSKLRGLGHFHRLRHDYLLVLQALGFNGLLYLSQDR